MSQDQSYTIRNLNECTFDQALELWNGGFSQYYSDMTMDLDRFTNYLGNRGISPQLSVAQFVGDRPAGFVLIAKREVDGKLLAWNGGTGVHPDFRGMGLARPLMKAAVDNMREANIHTVYLEVVTKNVKAIAAYEGSGFRVVDDLIGMKRKGSFTNNPFQVTEEADCAYSITFCKPAEVAQLPFFKKHVPWSGQWFQIQNGGGDALQVIDHSGHTVGFATFSKQYNNKGELVSIIVQHCEADPALPEEQANLVLRTALSSAFGPVHADIHRQTDNLRSSNPLVITALTEAGFEMVYEQKLMIIEF